MNNYFLKHSLLPKVDKIEHHQLTTLKNFQNAALTNRPLAHFLYIKEMKKLEIVNANIKQHKLCIRWSQPARHQNDFEYTYRVKISGNFSPPNLFVWHFEIPIIFHFRFLQHGIIHRLKKNKIINLNPIHIYFRACWWW